MKYWKRQSQAAGVDPSRAGWIPNSDLVDVSALDLANEITMSTIIKMSFGKRYGPVEFIMVKKDSEKLIINQNNNNLYVKLL